MRHRGRDRQGVYVSSEFSIICCDQTNNDRLSTVFGYVIKGLEVCEEISLLDPNDVDIVIVSCGTIG